MSKKKTKKSSPKKPSAAELQRLGDLAAENPGLLPFAHTAGSAPIVPTEAGAIAAKALSAMQEQTGATMDILADFMRLALQHANKVKDRVEVSHDIYGAKINFTPIIGKTYFLYEKADGEKVLSLIGPDEWGPAQKVYQSCLARVRLLHDHTWEIVERYQPDKP